MQHIIIVCEFSVAASPMDNPPGEARDSTRRSIMQSISTEILQAPPDMRIECRDIGIETTQDGETAILLKLRAMHTPPSLRTSTADTQVENPHVSESA